MQIKFVEIQNILSIGHIRLEFDSSGLVLLDGWNHDDASANGAGKSAIPNSIVYGLYDKIPRKISKSEIVRRGTKAGYVHVGVQIGDDLIEVKRHRPKNTEYYINGLPKSMTQEEFEDKIKMSYSQFLICMYAAQTEGKRFLSLNDTEMKDFILKLMNLDRFLIKKKEVDLKIKSLDSSKTDIEKLIISCESKLSVYREQLVDTDNILKEIESLDCSALEKSLNQASAHKEPDPSKYNEIKSQMQAKIRKLDSIDEAVREDRAIYAQLQREVSSLQSYDFSDATTCPSCKEEFMPYQDNPIGLEKHKLEINNKIKIKEKEMQEVVNRINSAPNTRKDRDDIANLSRQISQNEDHEKKEYYSSLRSISDIESKISIRKSKIASLTSQLGQQQEFQNKIKEINGLVSKASAKLAKINEEISISSVVSSILSPTGAPAYILDTIIDIFNEKVADYVSLIWPSASYQLQAFKENKSGDIKAKFSDKLIISGKTVSVGSLSGGEFRCLSLSIDFAIIDIVESIFGFTISPIFLDEPFEGLDQSNRERVIDLLDKISLDRQIWIIDHASEAKSMFANIVQIEKRNGTSDII